jgi:molybdopterin-biosynthesis enzyme MoeA-like protein
MVFEALSKAGEGGLGFSLAFLHESLASSVGRRPWVVVEGPDERRLFVAGLPRELRQAVQDRRLFWLRASEESALPELVQILLESSLCEGVLLRGFERFKSEHEARVWMRRWQLCSEKTRTHLLWVHERPCLAGGVNLRVAWSAERGREIKRGEGFLESTPFKTLRALSPRTQAQPRREDADRSTTRIA